MKSLCLCLLATAAVAMAQDDPLSAHNKMVYAGLKKAVLASADRMPEESYAFKPVDTVRSYGQLLGHIADSQYLFCSAVLGEANPAPKVEQTKTSKADLTAALNEAFSYCQKAYDTMTDAAGSQKVKLFAGEAPKLSVLGVNNLHTAEHYGNLATYLRMKNLVPPSSDKK